MKKKRVCTIFLSIIFAFSSVASASSDMTKTYTIRTDNSNYSQYTAEDVGQGDLKEIPKQIDNGFFTVKKISDIEINLDKKTLPVKKTWKNLKKKELLEKHKKYKGLPLLAVSWEKVEKEKRKKITGTYTISDVTRKPTFPEERNIKGVISGKSKTVKGKLLSSKEILEYEKPFSVVADFIGGDDVEYYVLGRTKIPVNNATPCFEGYEEIILGNLGMDSDIYKINKGEWISDYKKKNGEIVREAKFSGLSLVKSWVGYYEEIADEQDLIETVYHAKCSYGNYEKPMYDISITCIYGRTALKTERVILVSILLIALATSILILLFKRKKNKVVERK